MERENSTPAEETKNRLVSYTYYSHDDILANVDELSHIMSDITKPAFGHERYTPEKMGEKLTKAGNLILARDKDNQPIGFVTFYEVLTQKDTVLYFDARAVIPEYQQRGVGTELFLKAVEQIHPDVIVGRTQNPAAAKSFIKVAKKLGRDTIYPFYEVFLSNQQASEALQATAAKLGDLDKTDVATGICRNAYAGRLGDYIIDMNDPMVANIMHYMNTHGLDRDSGDALFYMTILKPRQYSEEVPQESIPDSVLPILSLEGVTLRNVFTSGNTGNFVARVSGPNNEDLVIKIPTNAQSQREIDENKKGYVSIEEFGLSEILPETRLVRSYQNIEYIISNFLGSDFAQMTRESNTPTNLYATLTEKLLSLYNRTLQTQSTDSATFLDRMVQLLKKNFAENIIKAGLVSEEQIGDLLDIEVSSLDTGRSCFAVFDFTPEDVYLTDEGIKYPDPKQHIGGNPIIDLACFAGTARDAYFLPGSDEGYDVLHHFATHEVAQLLGLSQDQAEKIFNLGRALQYSLSSRFRIKNEPEKAKEYAMKSIDYLKQIRKALKEF